MLIKTVTYAYLFAISSSQPSKPMTFKDSNNHNGACGSLHGHLHTTNFADFPDLDNFPLENYRIKYNNGKNPMEAYVKCKNIKYDKATSLTGSTGADESDKLSKRSWARKNKGRKHGARKGKYICDNGTWVAVINSQWSIPNCPKPSEWSDYYPLT